MEFDLYTQQGRWREWDAFFNTLVFTEGKAGGGDWSQKTALDIGCGTGWSTRVLAKRFKRVVGLEADANLIERAKAATPRELSKVVSFEYVADLGAYDAFGERFDFIFVGYTLAYMPNIAVALRSWALLLRPVGILAVLEIQSLFSNHRPLPDQVRIWFEKFDRDILRGFGYTSNAGTLMGDAVYSVPELNRVAFLEWRDPELSFIGPLIPHSPIWLGWEERWKRLWPMMTQSGVPEGAHEAFFNCLSHPQHYCEKPIRLLIAERSGTSPRLVTSNLKDKKESEEGEKIDAFYPGESGGGGGGD